MNYGKPEDDKKFCMVCGVRHPCLVHVMTCDLPIHEQVRQSRAALCGATTPVATPDKIEFYNSLRAAVTSGPYKPTPYKSAEEIAPLLTDESTARCVERNPLPTGGWLTMSGEYAMPGDYGRGIPLNAREAALAFERDDLARRCADLENALERMTACNQRLIDKLAKAQGTHSPVAPAAGVPRSDYDRLLERYHVADRLARELKTALTEARNELESLKAQDARPVVPCLSPHDMPAALGDQLPEPARCSEDIPSSAATQIAVPVSAKPAPGPMPARALWYSR